MSAVPHWVDIAGDRRPRRADLRPRGFTLLELIIVIILVALLFLTAYNRLMPLRGDAEAAHVTTVIGNLRSALGLAASERVMTDGVGALEELAGIDPVTLLQQVPDNYIGTAGASIPPGSWYFEPDARELRYRVRYPRYLEGAPNAPVDLAWRVRVIGEAGKPAGVHLAALDEIGWPGHSRALRDLRGAALQRDNQGNDQGNGQ